MTPLDEKLVRYFGLDDQAPYLVAHLTGIPFAEAMRREAIRNPQVGPIAPRMTITPNQGMHGVIAGWVSED